jgi:hypothetical protein
MAFLDFLRPKGGNGKAKPPAGQHDIDVALATIAEERAAARPHKAKPVRLEANPPDCEHRPRRVLKGTGVAFLDPLVRRPGPSRRFSARSHLSQARPM